jgi:hypothetical protein
LSTLPRRSAYARRFFLQAPPCPAGFAGRVAAHAHAKNLADPLLAFKFELEARLLADLKLPGQPLRTEVLGALRHAKLESASVDATAALLVELEEMQRRSQQGALRVSRRKFSRLVATGERILAELDAKIRS